MKPLCWWVSLTAIVGALIGALWLLVLSILDELREKKMKMLLLSTMFFLLFHGVCSAHEVTLEWDPNQEPDIAGYRIYQGTIGGSHGATPVAEIVHPTTQVVLKNLVDGTYFWVATAFDSSGLESVKSNEVSHTFTAGDPGAPVLRIKITVEINQ